MLTLRIENETTLPDGGPLSISVEGTRGIDIGRDQYLDWTLPDPNRFISGKHCEIRWRDGNYWLHDVSTNGTFLYGADGRLKAPHKLSDGDRFLIGHYIILTNISGRAAEAAAFETAGGGSASPDYENLWDPVGEAAPPIEARQLKAARDLHPVKPDFLDWAVDLQPPRGGPASQPPASAVWSRSRRSNEADWAKSSPKPPPPEPTPRRSRFLLPDVRCGSPESRKAPGRRPQRRKRRSHPRPWSPKTWTHATMRWLTETIPLPVSFA